VLNYQDLETNVYPIDHHNGIGPLRQPLPQTVIDATIAVRRAIQPLLDGDNYDLAHFDTGGTRLLGGSATGGSVPFLLDAVPVEPTPLAR